MKSKKLNIAAHVFRLAEKKGMKLLLSVIAGFWFISGFGQSAFQRDTTTVIGKEIVLESASQKHISAFKVLQILSGEVVKDTIWVNNSGINTMPPDTVLLQVLNTRDCGPLAGDSIFQCYDALGIQKIRCMNIPLSSWSVPVRNEEDIAWIPVNRDSLEERLFFFAPCFESGVNILVVARGMNRPTQEISLGGRECPAILDLTTLVDGKYHIYVHTCGISRFINIHLSTDM